MAELNPEAEKYISKILQRQIPYTVSILDCTFAVNDASCYPPGKLSELFASYIVKNNLVKDKIVVDAGAGSFALGIIAAKYGAKEVIGTEIVAEVVTWAEQNIINNAVTEVATILQGSGLEPLFPKYAAKVDLLLCGAPWDTISAHDFQQLPKHRQPLSRAFYDIDNGLIADVLLRAPLLLSANGLIFISASDRVMPRLKGLFTQHNVEYKIVAQQDIHNDGNVHYILQLESN